MTIQAIAFNAVKKFKTVPEAYQLAPDVFGLTPRNILFVSSNCWDACCAAWFGYTAFWGNRVNAPLEELGVIPDAAGKDMNALLDYVRQLGSAK